MKNYIVNIIITESIELRVPAKSADEAKFEVLQDWSEFDEVVNYGTETEIVSVVEE